MWKVFRQLPGAHALPEWGTGGSPSTAGDGAPAAQRGGATQGIIQEGSVQAVQVHRYNKAGFLKPLTPPAA
jgi:hypothetical protein